MNTFSNAERTDMVLVYGEAGGNSCLARELYSERFPNRKLPSSQTFASTVQHLRDYGVFKRITYDVGCYRTQRVLDAEKEIIEAFKKDPSISMRKLGKELGVSQSVVWRTIQEQGTHFFQIKSILTLQPNDLPRRIRFCQWLLSHHKADPGFISHILTTGEAEFTRTSITNVHGSQILCDQNPNEGEDLQDEHSFNVWVGIVDNQLLGPHIFPSRLNTEQHLQFLRTDLMEYIDSVPLAIRRDMWYLHDGATHHNQPVTEWLNANFTHRWIGPSGPVLWPARSPDLNPCDFFVWGHMRQLVYSTPVNTIDELKARVEYAAGFIRETPEIFKKVRESLLRRARACIDNGGRHFEQFL